MKTGEVRAFWEEQVGRLSEEARAGIAGLHRSSWGDGKAVTAERAFQESFADLVGEAELAAELVDGNEPLLEVGGGVALLHAFLRARGVDAWALEPSASGFSQSYRTGLAVLQSLHLPTEQWLPLPATEAARIGRFFPLILSHNMLEHVEDLPSVLLSLATVLSPGGTMRHHTVNYRIPYEPHFRIPLLPLAPQRTGLLFPSLARTPVWQGLNFLTPGRILAAGRAAGLQIEFQPGIFFETLERLETDPAFRRRHGAFLPLWRQMKRRGVAGILSRWPAEWATPLRFEATKA